MLKVRTYLDRSRVHGIGLFADEDIPQGKIIWEFHPHVDLVYSSQEWDELQKGAAPESFCQLEKYSYKEKGKFYICLDNAQFMNHHPLLNNIANDSERDVMFALCRIRKGEELLCNYLEFCDMDDVNLLKIKELSGDKATDCLKKSQDDGTQEGIRSDSVLSS